MDGNADAEAQLRSRELRNGDLLLEVVPVLSDIFPPLGGNSEFVEDRVDGTGRFAVGAIDTGLGIDVKHVVGIGG